jgi:GNAT superfamily N-acetyltransferase
MDDILSIRTTSRADLAEVDALFQRSYPALLKHHYPPSILVTAIPLISHAQPRLLASGSYFAVTDQTGAIVGAGGWTPSAPPGQRSGAAATGHVRHVVTDHRRVRAGIGRALMAHVFDDARGAGMTRLDCLSTLMAVPFYAACGFEEVGPQVIPLAPGIEFPAVLMRRSL